MLGRAKPAKILSRYPEIYRAGDSSVSSFQFLYQGTLRLAVITSIVYPHSSVCVGYCLLVASLRRCSPNKKSYFTLFNLIYIYFLISMIIFILTYISLLAFSFSLSI
jgi:hypothetical protein